MARHLRMMNAARLAARAVPRCAGRRSTSWSPPPFFRAIARGSEPDGSEPSAPRSRAVLALRDQAPSGINLAP